MGAAFSFELEQGRSIYQFLSKKVDCPIYYQRKLTARESHLRRDSKTGKPLYFILPYPYTYDRQLAVLHEYGHYLDSRPEYDPNLCATLSKRKAIKDHIGVRRTLAEAECIAWIYALEEITYRKYVIPQETYVSLIGEVGLRTYADLFNKYGGWNDSIKAEFDRVFDKVELVSPGFRQLPAIQNYLLTLEGNSLPLR